MTKSKRLGKLFATHTGNPGIAALARPIGFEFSMKELYRLEQFCRHESIGLVVVGPEGPLAEGIADKLANEQTAVFGPVKEAAQLEADKAWAKQLMRGAAIPTGEGRVFRDAEAAREYIRSRDEPPVVKATGLAAGKGVIVAATHEEALDAVERIMVRREFGAAGDQVLIEEKLKGPEISIFAITDGRNIAVLDPAQDYKRIGDGDTGPNTGGMGAYSPAMLLDARAMATVQRQVLVPTVDALRREGLEFRGVLYAGLMLTPGGPKVLEFNVRFGDPECQVLMRRFEGDLVDMLHAAATGRLADAAFDFTSEHAVCVVLAAGGYPGDVKSGAKIVGLDEAEKVESVVVFHAGTARNKDGDTVTAGGRILNITATGPTLEEARRRAYEAVSKIHFEGMQFRRDIAAPIKAAGASTR